jgi:TRAP-type C4-dicarboxylate transport system permease small subunit
MMRPVVRSRFWAVRRIGTALAVALLLLMVTLVVAGVVLRAAPDGHGWIDGIDGHGWIGGNG